MTLIDLAILQIEAKYKEVILPIAVAILLAILNMLHFGERSPAKILINIVSAGLIGWLTFFILFQKLDMSYEIASGFCGVSGYLTDKILAWLPKITDSAAKNIQNKIK
jgi:TctA family transporter